MEEPTPEGLQAARELLELKPHLFEGKDEEKHLRNFALFHASVGDDRFRLLGGLRPPFDAAEEAAVKFHTGELSGIQTRMLWEAHSRRPVDARMLRLFYDGLEKQIVGYGRLIHRAANQAAKIRAGVVAGWNEREAQGDYEEMNGKWKLSAEELMTVDQFAMEARAERCLPSAALGTEARGTVAYCFATTVLAPVSAILDPQGRGRIRPGSLAELARVRAGCQLVEAARLQSLMHEEYAAARIVLHARTATAAPVTISAAQVQVTADICNVTARDLGVNPPVAAATTPVTESIGEADVVPPKLWRLERWPDLKIALHGGKYYAFGSEVRPGDRVRIGAGVELPLSGERWRNLFDLASRSTDGRTISKRELLHRFGRTSDAPGSSGAALAAAEGLTIQDPVNNDYLRSFFSELRTRLQELIDCPGIAATALFVRSGNEVDLGFEVQALVGDGGHFTYGPRPG